MAHAKPNTGSGKHGRSGKYPTIRLPDDPHRVVHFVPNKEAEIILSTIGEKYVGEYISKAIIEYERNNSFRYDEEN